MTIVPTREQAPRLAGQVRRPTGRPGAPPAAGINLRDVLRILRRRWLLILITFLSVFGAVFVLTLLWRLYLPGYTAQALLRVEPTQMNILEVTNPFIPKEIIERNKRSQAALVESDPVLNAVAADPAVQRTTWYQQNPQSINQRLKDAITVSAVPETEFIELSMTIHQKEEVAEIVNSVANAFVRYAGEEPRKAREEKIRKLNEAGKTESDKLKGIRNQIAGLRANSTFAGSNERRSTVTLQLEMLTQQLNQAAIEEAQAAGALETLTKGGEGNAALDISVQQMLDTDPSLRNMEMQINNMAAQVSNLEAKLGPKHRSVEGGKAALAAMTGQYSSRRDETAEQYKQALVQSRRTAKAEATARVADLMSRLNLVQQQARDLESTVASINALSQQAQDSEGYLRRIEQRAMELELAGKGEGQTNEFGPVTLANAATTPHDISTPQWKLMAPAGILLGLLLGVGLAFVVELSDTSIKNPSDITRLVDLPLLGMVPHNDDLDEDVSDFRRVVQLAPHSPAAEAFRHIRTNLLFSGPAQERRSLLVTSSAPEDGRTTVVMNLAASIAQSGRRVLVVDANFRQPAVAAMFPEAAPAGLSSVLVGQAAWRDVVSATDLPNFSVITSGPLPPNPAELLGSDIMRQLVTEMAGEYEQVIFDSCPALVVADALVLATQVDGVIFVVRAGHNSAGIIQRASEQLNRVGAHVLGVVLQGVRTTAGGYLRKNYETFYEYQQKVLPQTQT